MGKTEVIRTRSNSDGEGATRCAGLRRQRPHCNRDTQAQGEDGETKTTKGRKPLYASTFVADHLQPAAKSAGVHIADGQRFGVQNLRHSLSNWLVNKAKVEPKTGQGILRRAKIQTTLDPYTQGHSPIEVAIPHTSAIRLTLVLNSQDDAAIRD